MEKVDYKKFRVAFRKSNRTFAKDRGDRYYKTLHAAYKARVQGDTIFRFQKHGSYIDVVRYDQTER